MNTTIEMDFPRGNRHQEPTEFRQSTKRKDDQLFFDKPKGRKKKKITREEFELNLAPVNLELAKIFNYSTLRDGMVVLGCIDNITDLGLKITLPNQVLCFVKINSITDQITKKVIEQISNNIAETATILNEMFQLGQQVPVKIQNIEKNPDDKYSIESSLNPRDINEDKMHYSLVKGATIWTNIETELDHGYELTAGIANCRIFLPFKNIDDQRKYQIGEPLYCIVHKYQYADNITTLSVSAKREHLNKCQVEHLDLHVLLPGTRVEFFVEELQENGVKGKVFNTYDGFIDKNYQFGLKKHFKEGKTVFAYVLFIETITGIVYLTLRGLDVIPLGALEIGKIVTAPVVSIAMHGIYLDLGDNCTGYVSNKRIRNTIESKDTVLKDFIETEYRIGSRHKCRILHYNRMEQIYICTVEPHIIKEKVFTINDLEIGAKYVVTIIAKKPEDGLFVRLGRIHGLIPNLHLAQSQHRFKEGQQINARLLSIIDQQPIFTIRSELVEADNCLIDTTSIDYDREYVGFVIHVSRKGVIIGFCNNITGWLSCAELNFGNLQAKINPEEYYFKGQIVHVWVLKKKKDDTLQLSLLSKAARQASVLLGQKYCGVIVRKKPPHLILNINGNIVARLPALHLSRNVRLSQILYDSYWNGKKIWKTICIRDTLPPILSRREYLVNANKSNYKQLKFDDLRQNMVLRTSMNKLGEKGVFVNLHLKDFKKLVCIPYRSLFDHPSNLQKYQCILAKILAINRETKQIKLGTTPQLLNLQNIEYSTNLLLSYIHDIELIQKLRQSPPYKVGMQVRCIVKKFTSDQRCIVQLPDKSLATVPSHLYPEKLQIKTVMAGVILAYNVDDNSFYVSLRRTDRLKIHPVQDGTIKKPLNWYAIAKILLITEFYSLGLLIGVKYNHQLIYLPVDFNENDPNLINVYNREYMRVLIVKRYRGKLFGVPIDFVRLTEQAKIKKELVKKPMKIRNKQPATIEETDKIQSLDEVDETIAPVLSSIDNFYATDEPILEDPIDEDEDKPTKPTVKLSKAEWKKQEEARIRKIEQELADTTATPQSVEQFERSLLANPNSVELWLKYIATLISATELSKARAVGQQALEKISSMMVEEKQQIWIALLNMENLYGTRESFEELFERAIKFNETFPIYIKVIKMLANSGKINEMEEKIKKLRNKEKQNVQMWLEIGQIYYNLNKYRDARNVQEAALKSITDKKRQFEIILRFGIMEFQFGELEHAVQLFETILDVYSKKINIWIVYVDQLIKKQEYEMARKVLERAIRHKFPVKNMRTLYQKFITFEEQFGNADNVQQIKQMAKDYVEKISHKV